jgi:transposase
MLWVGLDLHKHYITACAMDEPSTIVAEHRRLATDDTTLLGWLSALPGPVTVAMEATLHWAWLHDRLTAAGHAAVAVQPYQVKLIRQARCKTDPIDARKLAELGRCRLLPTIWVPDAETRARRKLLRGRAYLVRLRTRLKNRIHGYLTAENCRCLVTDLYGKAGRAWLQAVRLHEISRLQVDLLLEMLDALDARIRRLDQRVRRTVTRARRRHGCKRCPGSAPSAPSSCWPRSVGPTALPRAINWQRTPAWYPARGVRATRPRRTPWGMRGALGSSGS